MTRRQFILLAIVIMGCSEEQSAPRQKPSDIPSISIDHFQLTETRQGRRLWVLNAVTADVFTNLIQAETVTIYFYNEQPVPYSVLTAHRATLNTSTHDIVVREQVVLVTDDSTRLNTDSLFWRNDSQRIITDSYVRILKPDSTILEGNGLATTPDLKKIEIIGTVTGTSPIQFPRIR